MHFIRRYFYRLQQQTRCMKLIDKSLVVIMIICIFQICYNLITHDFINNANDNVDVFIRSTAASIFGYFISANFIRSETSSEWDSPSSFGTTPPSPPETVNKNELAKAQQPMTSECKHSSSYDARQLQIFIVTIIAIISLVCIIIVRNCYTPTLESLPAISQLRDFVCSSVGFLLGFPTNSVKPPKRMD